MRHSVLLAGAIVWLASGLAWAQTQPDRSKARSPREEERRKLLEEIGLQKQKGSPSPAPLPEPHIQDEPAPDTAAAVRSAESVAGAHKTTVTPAALSFRRVIHPLLMATCSACHRVDGPAGATRLTLSGDAAADHLAVVGLVTVREPAASALLVKVSGQAHAGGSPWPRDSGAYTRILAWVAKGARLDAQGAEKAAQAPAPVSAPTRKKSGGPPPASTTEPVAPAVAVATPDTPSSPAAAPAPPATPVPVPNGFRGVHQILMSSCATCHRAGGSAATTRMVLSGDAAADEAIARTLIEPTAPAESLLLTKAAGAMHAGGAALPEGDPRREVLLAWATPAAPAPAIIAPRVPESPRAGAASQPSPMPPPVVAPSPRPGHPRHGGGVDLPLGFLLNGRFDLNYERRQFTGHAFGSEGVDALRSYHHFLFLSRERADEPCGLSVEVLALTFWEAHCRVMGRSRPVALAVAGGKIVVPFGADPLHHQSYGGLAGFDQRILPPVWAEEGLAAHLLYERGGLVLSDDAFLVRGYGLGRADGVLNLQNDFSSADDVHLGWGNRLGAAWKAVSAWYSAYFNPLGFNRHLFMQAIDVTVYRQRSIPVVGHFSFGAGLLRADVAGGDAAGVGGVGKDYYHFGSYFQVRYHPTDWLFAQYRQGLRTFDNRRGVILDNSRLTNADGSTHSFGLVGRYRGLTAGIYYFINLEKVDEIPDDLFRVSVAYEF